MKNDETPPALEQKGQSKLGKKLEDQAREKIRQEDTKRAAFARGRKRFTEGK